MEHLDLQTTIPVQLAQDTLRNIVKLLDELSVQNKIYFLKEMYDLSYYFQSSRRADFINLMHDLLNVIMS